MSQTAVLGLSAMLETVIQEDAALGAVLSGRKVFLRRPIKGASLPYVVLSGTTETPLRAGFYNGQGGHHGTELLRSYARTLTTAREIYARLVALLDGRRPVVVGHTIIRGTLEYVDDLEEEAPAADGTRAAKAWGVLSRYRIWSLEVT